MRLTKLALAMSLALSAVPAFAQNTTSAVGGRITDPVGAPEAGAAISILHVESGTVSNVVTDAQGRYSARGLRTGGPYTITITKNGLTEKRENVYLQLAETASIDATLGAPIQTVTVAGSLARSDKFSRSSMGAGTAISATELQTQASINRNLQDYARADPRVSQTDKERGELSVAGQNSRYNSLTIDGVAVNDTFGLESNGSPTARQPISIEAIQSVQVNVANYDVTQKAYTGANINAVTKSGTNDWKGGVYYVYRNDRTAGDKFNVTTGEYTEPAKFKETTKGAWAAGPLIQDKLFIYALSEESRSTRTAPDFGPIGGGAGTTVGITQSAIAAAQAIAKDTYKTDIGGTAVPSGSALTSKDQLIKLDWNINEDHRASFRYAKTEQSEPFFPSVSATGVSLDSFFYSQAKTIETMVGQVVSDWSPTFSTEFRLSNRDYDSVPKNNANLPSIGLQFSGALPAGTPSAVPTGNRFLNFGTESSRQNNVLQTKTQDFFGGATWSLGDHEVKFGGDYNQNKIYNAFLQNVNGNYTFACIDSSATFTYSFGAIACNGRTTTNAQIEAAVLENFRRGRPQSYTVQQPVPGGTLDSAVSQFTLKNTGLFLQDTWNFNKQLTLSYGVRIDQANIGEHPLRNTAAAAPVIAGVNGGRQTGGFGYDNTVTIDGQRLIQPRAGFNYKFETERPMQLRGGAGLFQGAAASVWLSNPFSNPGVATRIVTCSTTATIKCPTTDNFFSIDPAVQPQLSGVPAANVDFLDPSLRQPSIMKANLGFEAELPWYGIVASAEYLYTKNKDALYYRNLNLGAATAIGPDGRPLYYNAAGRSASCFTSNAGNTTPVSGCLTTGVTAKALSNVAFNNVLLADKTDKGEGRVSTLSLSRPMIKGFGWSVAATHTAATEVSPLTSSVSSSNFNGRSVYDPNENIAENSNYLVKNRINALLNFQKKFFGAYNTRLGIFYEGRSGKPFSWTVNNDLNGDGVAGNDLMFIPSAFGSGQVTFLGDSATSKANEQKFWDVVNGDKDLRNAAGGVVHRNGSFAPWTNSFDLRISQEVPGFFSRNKGSIALDFLNFGNLLNKKWGHINEVAFQSAGGLARSFVDYAGLDAQGRYVYAVRPQVENYDIRQAKGESQWAIQATVKYEF